MLGLGLPAFAQHSACSMCPVGGEVVAAGVGADAVVAVHRTVYGFFRIIEAGECPVQSEVVLEDTVDPFGNGVLVRVSVLGHRYPDVVVSEHLHVLIAAVLRTTVAVMDERGLPL